MDRETVDALLAAMVTSADHVSDLIFIQGKPPLVESHGQLQEFAIDTAAGSALTSEIIDDVADHVLNGNQRLLDIYAATGSVDTSYEIPGVARLRVNIYKQVAGRSLVMRKLPSEIPSFEKLGLPPVFREIIKERNGMILVTGATGSGKTTTLASMLNQVNLTQPFHILTLEDPIEFLYPPGRAAVSQRELGRDFESFSHGLRVALRQAPKAILLGEIRDRETMEIALSASETGHIVFSTLHTINAGQTINRNLGVFHRDAERPVRSRLADTLRYVVSQRLVPNASGSRSLITEVIGQSLRTREAIRYGEAEGKTFQEIIEAASTQGWHTFDQCLFRGYEGGTLTEENALLFCTNKGQMRRDIDGLRKKTTANYGDSLSGLKLDKPVPITIAPEGNHGATQASMTASK